MGNAGAKGNPSAHGLHFKAKTTNEKLKKTTTIVVEFDGLVFLDKKGEILYRPSFKQITGWGSSPNNKKLTFQFEAKADVTFTVSNAKAIERAILVRLDVFRSSDKFAATTLIDPSKKFPHEVILQVRKEGIVVSDPTGKSKTRIIEFVVLSGWGAPGPNEVVLEARDQSRYKFACEDAPGLVQKLDEVAKMLARSMSGGGKPQRDSVVDRHHAEDEEQAALEYIPGLLVTSPFGPKVLPENVALTIIGSAGIRLVGMGSFKGSGKKVTIQFTSLQQYAAYDGNIDLQLIESKGGSHIVIQTESQDVAQTFCNTLNGILRSIASGKQYKEHAAPKIPDSLAQVGAIKARRLSGNSATLEQCARLSMAGQQMLSSGVTAPPVEVVNDFSMGGMRGQNGELLNLPEKLAIVVETAGRLTIIDPQQGRVAASWGLQEIAGWQALDSTELLIVFPQGKLTFFMEDAEILASVLEDACLAYTEALRRDHSAQQGVAQLVPNPPAPQFINFTVPAGVQPGQVITVKAPDGRDVNVKIPLGVGAGAQMKVPIPAVGPPPPPPPSSSTSTGGGQQIQFTVLKGMKPGQVITVKNANNSGKNVTFTLPGNLKPGDSFQVQIPNDNSSAAPFSVESSTVSLTLTVPPQFKKKGGDKLQIKYQGKRMFVKIPESVGPGQTFSVRVPKNVGKI